MKPILTIFKNKQTGVFYPIKNEPRGIQKIDLDNPLPRHFDTKIYVFDGENEKYMKYCLRD